MLQSAPESPRGPAAVLLANKKGPVSIRTVEMGSNLPDHLLGVLYIQYTRKGLWQTAKS
jgi:hypothetical protein